MSYSIGDELQDDVISNCCSAAVIYPERCNDCYENCSAVAEDENDDA